MRQQFPDILERGRVLTGHFATRHGERYGAFSVTSPISGMELNIVASDGNDEGTSQSWEHVSVSARKVPNWQEMCWLKDLFWDDEESVVQFHPPKSQYVNYHKNCLHLWRHRLMILPPTILVGPRNAAEAKEQLKLIS